MVSMRHGILSLAVSILVVAIPGCALLEKGWNSASRRENAHADEKKGLRPVSASRHAVHVEIVFVERPAHDPLFKEVWEELDQLGPLDPPIREALKRNGLRVGVASSSPPRRLQKMLGLSTVIPHDSAEDSGQLVGRRVALVSGTETEIQTSPIYPACTIAVREGSDTQSKEYNNARCLFRLKAHRVQDGWAKLEFLPEIHSGQQQRRALATGVGWQLRTAQEITPLFNQKFEVSLNVGEMAVISVDETEADSLGGHFFAGSGGIGRTQRLLVVRLADMTRMDPVYAAR